MRFYFFCIVFIESHIQGRSQSVSSTFNDYFGHEFHKFSMLLEGRWTDAFLFFESGLKCMCFPLSDTDSYFLVAILVLIPYYLLLPFFCSGDRRAQCSSGFDTYFPDDHRSYTLGKALISRSVCRPVLILLILTVIASQ